MNTSAIFSYTKYLFTTSALFFLAFLAYENNELLLDIITGSNSKYLIASTLLWMLLHLISPALTSLILKELGTPVIYTRALMIHTQRLPARYLPGGIWHTVARAVDYKNQDIPVSNIAFYLIVEHLLAATMTLTIGGWVLLTHNIPDPYSIIYIITVFSTLAACTLPLLLKYSPYRNTLRKATYVRSLIVTSLFWLIASTSFISFLHAFDSIGIDQSIFVAGGVYVFSWGIGFLAVFAPQGVGVTEYTASLLLETSIPVESFIVLLASFRINILVADTATWLISLVFKLKNHHSFFRKP